MHRKKYFRDEPRHTGPRVNFHIRIPEIRVVQDGKQLGIMQTEKARQLALDQGLDLVEIAPTARPPVCHILDYGKYRYEQKIKERETARKQRESEVHYKEIRLGPHTADHDIEFKVKHARQIIAEGDKIQINVRFKNRREMMFRDQGFAVLNKFLEQIKDAAVPEDRTRMEGKSIICRLGPPEKIVK